MINVYQTWTCQLIQHSNWISKCTVGLDDIVPGENTATKVPFSIGSSACDISVMSETWILIAETRQVGSNSFMPPLETGPPRCDGHGLGGLIQGESQVPWRARRTSPERKPTVSDSSGGKSPIESPTARGDQPPGRVAQHDVDHNYLRSQIRVPDNGGHQILPTLLVRWPESRFGSPLATSRIQ